LSRFARTLRTEHVVDQLRRHTDPARIHALLTGQAKTHYAA
jgi:mannitol/fructose-specific phosphotransferase system IIA component (Ntr-type)